MFMLNREIRLQLGTETKSFYLFLTFFVIMIGSISFNSENNQVSAAVSTTVVTTEPESIIAQELALTLAPTPEPASIPKLAPTLESKTQSKPQTEPKTKSHQDSASTSNLKVSFEDPSNTNSTSNESSNPEFTSEPEDFEKVNLSDALPNKGSESEEHSEKKSLQLMAAEYEEDPFSSQKTIFYVISSILILGIIFLLVRKIWL